MQFINKPIFFLGIFFLFISCSGNQDKTPLNILNKDEMVAVLIDIQLADATVNLSKYGQSHFPGDKVKLFDEIYSKHKITKKKFEESFVYYTDHPEKFQKIYAEVITGLSRKQAELAK